MKKVLLFTYYWPPSGGSGVQRWVYFSKYLLEHGYEPIIVTIHEKSAAYRNLDHSLQEYVKNIRTYRTKATNPLKAYSLITTGSKHKGIPVGHVKPTKFKFVSNLATFIRGNFFIPDARIGWNKFAFRQAQKIIQTEKIDFIITTGPPHSTHLIGQKLKSLHSVKWIADFRDPWTELYYLEEMKQTKWARKKDLRFEKSVIRDADILLTVGNELKNMLIKKYPEFDKSKFRYIYNGFDSDLLKSVEVKEHDSFEITFIGTLTKNQPYIEGFQAIKTAISSHRDKHIKLVLAGNIQEEIINYVKAELDDIPVEMHGYISHSEAISLMKRSRLLLNFLALTPHSKILISGKQMEYIATGNPILCIGNTKGELASILSPIPNAEIFEKDQLSAASQFIEELIQKWDKKISITNNINTPYIESKSRKATTKELVELLNKI